MLAHWQAKRHEDLHSHMGQLCAELKVTREQYCRKELGKRKREADPLLAKVHTYVGNVYVL
jgi:hypothetical protein